MIVLEKLERIKIPLRLCCVEVCDLLCKRAAQESVWGASVGDVPSQPGLLLQRGHLQILTLLL